MFKKGRLAFWGKLENWKEAFELVGLFFCFFTAGWTGSERLTFSKKLSTPK